LEISFYSHPGRVRTNNEDACLVIPPWQEPAITAGACCFAVADGIGGHAGGEIASRLAVEAIKEWLHKNRRSPFLVSSLENAFNEANQEVWNYSRSHPNMSKMGTTLTAVFITSDQALIGHVGDTRIYLLRAGELRQLSSDHTLVYEQVRLGHLTPEAAKTHPAKHILSRALGVREFINIDTMLLELLPNDILFLCSDGITGMITEQQICDNLKLQPFKDVTKKMVDDANEAGGEDNSTAVAFQVDRIPVPFPGRYSLQRLKAILTHWGDSYCG